MASQRSLFKKLVRRLEPELQTAFLSSIDEIVSRVDLAEVIAALERGDIEAAVNVIAVNPAAYERFRAARQAAYITSGSTYSDNLPRTPQGARLVVRFDTRAPNAEDFLQRQSSQEVTVISDEQRDSLREALTAGMERGDNPRTTARSVVGKIDPKTGRRTGGIIGLSAPQERAMRAARLELTSPSTMHLFKNRTLRNRQLDRLINTALKEERGLSSAEVQQLLDAYSNRMLDFRAETIGRTESLTALHAGKRQAYQQAIDEGSVKPAELERYWDATGDNKVRESHAALDRETASNPIGWDDDYVSPVTGARIRYPHDPEAPASEIINCRCDERIEINFIARFKRNRQRSPG